MKLNSIQIKIVTLIVAVLVASTGVSIYFTVANQRRNLLEATERTLGLNTDMLNRTVRSLMLSGEAPGVVRTMSSLAEIPGFREIAIYRRDGKLAFSDYTTLDFVHNYQKKYRFERTPRVEARLLEEPGLARVLATNTPYRAELPATQELQNLFPILNYKECRECHGQTPFIRGVVHSKVSVASIYERIRAARNILSLSFLAIGAAIAVLLILSVQRTIIAPVLSIARTARSVGRGDLEQRIRLSSRDELGQLGQALNDMIDGLRQRERLELRNQIVEARNAENRKYLDNIQEGLLLLDRGYTIGGEHSLFLQQLFGGRQIAGVNFLDFVFPDAALQAEDRRELEQFLGFLFEKTASDMELIQQINPLRNRTLTIRQDGAARQIVVDASFHRIYSGSRVQNAMVIFQDRTELSQVQRELEAQRERGEEELRQIAAILQTGPQGYEDFVTQARQAVGELEASLQKLGDAQRMRGLFRQMHTLKGAARYLELSRLEAVAHAVEDILGRARDRGVAPEAEAAELGRLIRSLYEEIEHVQLITARFHRFGTGKPTGGSLALLEQLRGMAVQIAAEQGKQVRLAGEGLLADGQLLAALRDPLIHLVRNAVDHGIEEPLERVAAGKPEQGTITVRFVRGQGMQVVQVADDGRGIDFAAVRRKAVQKGLVRPESPGGEAELLRVLFSPAFSSREEVSAISGRGVGLDIVAEAARSLGGRIAVLSRAGRGTRFTLRIPRVIAPGGSAPAAG